MNSPSSARQQLQYIQDFLIQIASGDYNSKLPVINEDDGQMVAIQFGINMLVEELKESTISRVFLDSIYNGINEILIVLNEKEKIQKTNHLVNTLLLYNESELLNQSIEKLLQKTDFDNVRDCIKNAYEQGKIQEIGLNLYTKDNNIIPVSCSFSPLKDAKGKPSGILMVAKNISTLTKAKNQLQDKNDELSLFVYKASHDLKSPVTSITSILELQRESQDINEVRMYSQLIANSAARLDTIISELLILGRITYGKLEYNKVNFRKKFDDIIAGFEFVDGFKDVNINIVIDQNVKPIITEKGLLHTILFNLIDNAIKYRQKKVEPSYIDIHLSKHEKGILFKIKDNGIGIADSLQADIFKMFYRATSKSKGSGLGLYIVQTAVTKLGGTISMESTANEGTTFKIYVPSKLA